MAGSILIPLKTVFDNKGLKQAQSEFSKIGGSLKGILGAAGIGIGLSAVTNALKESTKAAIDDVKSQALLAQQLRNTVGANEGQIASVEKSIATMQMQASIADDVIRPAFASLVRATGDVGRATELTSLALDVAAGTGKDLGAVSLALGKAINGSTTSLLKLVPSIKGASDPMGELAKQFDGAAAAASNSDPIQAISIIMGELQEQIGAYLLPALKDLATYLKSSEFAGAVDSAFIGFDKIFGAVDSLISRIPVLGDAMNGLGQQLANGEWTKFIPIIGSWIDLLNNSNPKRGANAESSRMTGQALAYQASLKLGTGKGPAVATTTASKSASAAQKKAEADAKAAASKAAKARQAIIDAANKAAEEAKKAFDDLKVSIDDFNKSFADTASGFQEVFKFSTALGDFEQQTVDAFDTIKQSAKDAFDSKLISASALSGLLAYADREKALLQGIAKQRDVLAKKISIAQAVTSGVMGSLNITAMLESETKQVTKSVTSMVNGIALTTTQTFDEVVSGGLADSFRKLVDKTKTFATNLNKLKSLGLNGNLFKQIVADDTVQHTVELAREIYEETSKKTLIFSQFVSTCHDIHSRLENSLCITGEDSDESRYKKIDEFQNNPDMRYMVLSTKAGAEGITLTAAHYIIFNDLCWTPKDHRQAEARGYWRMNDLPSATAYYMQAEGTVTETIMAILRAKMDIIEKTVDGINKSAAEGQSIITEFLQKLKGGM